MAHQLRTPLGYIDAASLLPPTSPLNRRHRSRSRERDGAGKENGKRGRGRPRKHKEPATVATSDASGGCRDGSSFGLVHVLGGGGGGAVAEPQRKRPRGERWQKNITADVKASKVLVAPRPRDSPGVGPWTDSERQVFVLYVALYVGGGLLAGSSRLKMWEHFGRQTGRAGASFNSSLQKVVANGLRPSKQKRDSSLRTVLSKRYVWPPLFGGGGYGAGVAAAAASPEVDENGNVIDDTFMRADGGVFLRAYLAWWHRLIGGGSGVTTATAAHAMPLTLASEEDADAFVAAINAAYCVAIKQLHGDVAQQTPQRAAVDRLMQPIRDAFAAAGAVAAADGVFVLTSQDDVRAAADAYQLIRRRRMTEQENQWWDVVSHAMVPTGDAAMPLVSPFCCNTRCPNPVSDLGTLLTCVCGERHHAACSYLADAYASAGAVDVSALPPFECPQHALASVRARMRHLGMMGDDGGGAASVEPWDDVKPRICNGLELRPMLPAPLAAFVRDHVWAVLRHYADTVMPLVDGAAADGHPFRSLLWRLSTFLRTAVDENGCALFCCARGCTTPLFDGVGDAAPAPLQRCTADGCRNVVHARAPCSDVTLAHNASRCPQHCM